MKNEGLVGEGNDTNDKLHHNTFEVHTILLVLGKRNNPLVNVLVHQVSHARCDVILIR